MTDREQPTTRLERLGAEPGPSVDPAFANRLETDLRLAMIDRATPSARPWWQPVLVGVASLLVLLAAGVALRSFTAAPSTELVMTAADDTEVILPGGTSAEGVAGLELPDGTRITVGAAGQAVIDGVVLAPGSVAVVANGRLELLPTTAVSAPADPDVTTSEPPPADAPTPGDSTPGDPTTSTVEDQAARPTTTSDQTDAIVDSTVTDGTARETDTTTTTNGRNGGGSSTSAPGTTTATTTRPSTEPTATSATSAPPSSTTSIARTTTEATRPTTTTSVDPTVTLDVEAIGDTRLRLTWSVRGAGAGVPGFEVLGYEVQVVANERARTLLLVRDGAASTATVERLEADVGYRVRAIGDGGDVLATSPVIDAP